MMSYIHSFSKVIPSEAEDLLWFKDLILVWKRVRVLVNYFPNYSFFGFEVNSCVLHWDEIK